MATTNNDDLDDNSKRPSKKGKTIQPLSANDQPDKTDSSVLAELAARAAELAESVKGPEEIKSRILELDDLEDSEQLLKKLEQDDAREIDESNSSDIPGNNSAVELIRNKLNKLYATEPDAESEAAETLAMTANRSKHQQKMYDITTSGNSLAEIQTQWHNYYVNLPNDQKHEVWQEFYQNQNKISKFADQSNQKSARTPRVVEQRESLSAKNIQLDNRSPQDIKSKIMNSVSAGGKLKPVHHLKSLFFGLGLSGVAMLVIAFVFFNQVFVAPLISPSQSVSATPILGDPNGPVDPESKIIIPKINLEVPVVFGLNTVAEEEIQKGLESGVVHYSSTPDPGQNGNSVIVGHSSNNILNSGKYKFAFVLLRRLEIGDVFYINKDSVRYSYKIYDKKVVTPDDVSVLGPAERDNSTTLITCDPPGTSRNRLIIIAEQISPDPTTNKAATPLIDSEESSAELPSNAPSLISRFWPF